MPRLVVNLVIFRSKGILKLVELSMGGKKNLGFPWSCGSALGKKQFFFLRNFKRGSIRARMPDSIGAGTPHASVTVLIRTDDGFPRRDGRLLTKKRHDSGFTGPKCLCSRWWVGTSRI